MSPRDTRMLLLVIPLLAACNHKTLTVQSDTTWQGDVTGFGTFSGTGGADIDLENAPSRFCWTLKKTTSAGTLRAYLHEEDWFGLHSNYTGDATTTAPSGEIGGCIQ